MESTNTFGKSVKGAATMGSKHRSEANLNPGPGQYNTNSMTLKSKISQGKIGTTKRADLWGADKQKMSGTPGPGSQPGVYSSFAKTKGGQIKGNGRKDVINSNPGPGSYNHNDRISSAKTGSYRIGT